MQEVLIKHTVATPPALICLGRASKKPFEPGLTVKATHRSFFKNFSSAVKTKKIHWRQPTVKLKLIPASSFNSSVLRIRRAGYGRYSQNSVLSQRTSRRVRRYAIVLLPQRIFPTPVIPTFSFPSWFSSSLLI